MRRDLGGGGEIGGDRRGRAFIHIGRPHMERHGGDLEGQARDQEHKAEDQADAERRHARSRRRCRGNSTVPVKP